MEMKNRKDNLYVYETSTGVVEVELDPKWIDILEEEDRKFNTATRHYERHNLQMDVLQESSWMYSDQFDPLAIKIRDEDSVEMNKRCRKILRAISKEDRKQVFNIGLKCKTEAEYAKELAVTQQAVSKRKIKIQKKVKKII